MPTKTASVTPCNDEKKKAFLNNAEGSYFPSFFLIKIESDEDISEILESQTATFIHEYIHFLQDLILPYCIRENLIKLREFFLTSEKLRGDGHVKMPVNLIDEDLAITERQASMTWGGRKIIQDVNKIIAIESESVPMMGPNGSFDVFKHTMKADDGTQYHIGARDFLEYIAYKIQKKIFPESTKLPDLPYQSVDLLFEYLDLASVREEVRVAIAEYCLLNDNPMRRFLVLINDIKSLDVAILDDSETCKNYLLGANWQAKGQPAETISGKIERRIGQLREMLQYRFPIQAFPGIYAWIDSIITYARNELAGKLFFSHLYGLGEAGCAAALGEVLEKIGIPIIINKQNHVGTSLEGTSHKGEFLQLLMAYAFSDYIKGEYLTCPMCNICEENNPSIVNDDCYEAPFRRASDENLCPFGAFVKSNGFANLIWYENGRVVRGGPSINPS